MLDLPWCILKKLSPLYLFAMQNSHQQMLASSTVPVDLGFSGLVTYLNVSL